MAKKELPPPCCTCEHRDEASYACKPELGKVGDKNCECYMLDEEFAHWEKPPEVKPKKTKSRTK